jgi:hypothetical protein
MSKPMQGANNSTLNKAIPPNILALYYVTYVLKVQKSQWIGRVLLNQWYRNGCCKSSEQKTCTLGYSVNTCCGIS